MSPKSVLKAVKKQYPELQDLPKKNLQLVEKAILFTAEITANEELLTDAEHGSLMDKIGPRQGQSPASRLKAYRLRQELTQKDLAKVSGISQANISAMENGRRPIGLRTAKKLADALSCDYKRIV